MPASKKRVLRVRRRSKPKPEQNAADPSATQRQVSERWTDRIADLGWTPISVFFLRNYHRLNVSHTEAMVVVHLMSYKWDANAPFPSLKTIAKQMGITPASVRTHLRNLEKKKLLRREIQTGTTNKFHLDGLFRALERLIAKQAEKDRQKQAAESFE